jgi:hypothetical protein
MIHGDSFGLGLLVGRSKQLITALDMRAVLEKDWGEFKSLF